ncbi:uncharacterized protein LOC124924129 [Impatiens glandulifera]|uniref:uncharacterized protein LOC124924129 n=1 Tax=Impatiens glandulifera TaxID=253017 RepID=UPI001FB0C61B|nr:uncharacterized protein LOC124924129 [Impatiens glandulifera]
MAITLMFPAIHLINSSSALSSYGSFTKSKFKSKIIHLSLHNPRNGGSSEFLTHCSIRPNTESDSSLENRNATPGHNSNSDVQEPDQPSSNRNVKFSESSFSTGLVFDLGVKESWDGSEIGSPVVKRYLGDEEERWYMWYHGSPTREPNSDSIGLAVSRNGIHWERGGGPVRSSVDTGVVMKCSKDWWAFDTESIRPCEVVIMSSEKVKANNAVYWLYYIGYNSEMVDNNNPMGFDLQNPERSRLGVSSNKVYKSLPGLAMSQDGRHWARIEGEHHSGALFDVGSNGEWDSMFIASPQVIFHASGDLRMYYHTFDAANGSFAVGMARSRDGIKWVKLGRILGRGGGGFDELGAMNARVVRNRKSGEYLMAYEGVDGKGKRSIGLAMSADGLKNWERIERRMILKASECGWDSIGVGSPCLVQMEDEWRLYYRGIGMGGETGIGMAVSDGGGGDIFKATFTRWTGFHRQE